MRDIYKAYRKIFSRAISEIGKLIDLDPFRDMLTIGLRHPECLDNIG